MVALNKFCFLPQLCKIADGSLFSEFLITQLQFLIIYLCTHTIYNEILLIFIKVLMTVISHSFFKFCKGTLLKEELGSRDQM